MSDSPRKPPPCSECGRPALLAHDLDDVYAEHCSTACSIARWNRDMAEGRVAVVAADLDEIDQRLSTTGLDAELLS